MTISSLSHLCPVLILNKTQSVDSESFTSTVKESREKTFLHALDMNALILLECSQNSMAAKTNTPRLRIF